MSRTSTSVAPGILAAGPPMPRGAAVLPYDGKRGRVWRIKWADADGKQGMETIGAERHALFKTALREELVDANPAEAAERPKVKSPKWRILEPAEVARVAKAFTDDQARAVFLTLVLTGVRRFELQALRWRDVDLLE